MATSNRKCKLPTSSFCYVCGYYTGPKQKKHKIVRETKFYVAYEAYFSRLIKNVGKTWVPEFCCGSCRSSLEGWLRGTRKCMPFAVPRIWTEPTNHYNNCYFCMVDINMFTGVNSNRLQIEYPNIPSSVAPLLHSATLPVPELPVELIRVNDKYDDECDDGDDSWVADFSAEPHFPNQDEVNDLIRDLGLTKTNSEILMSRLKEWNLLESSCRVSSNRKRHKEFSSSYQMAEQLCFCADINGLFENMGIEHIPTEWRLFIDSSKNSLKGVLLHNGNIFPSIPVAHSAHMKEDYENVKYTYVRKN